MIKKIKVYNQKHLNKMLSLFRGYAKSKNREIKYSYNRDKKEITIEINE